MNDLFTETVTVIKIIDNFFLEFENQFAFSFQDVDFEIYDKEVKFDSDEEYINYIIETKLFEKYFNWMSKKIINHLQYQLEQKNEKISILLFLQRQIDYSIKYNPDDRKQSLLNAYKVIYIAGGDERILEEDYLLSDYKKTTLKISFEAYKTSFNKISSKIKYLYKLFSQTHSSFDEENHKQLIENEKLPLLFENLLELGFFKLPKTMSLSEKQQKSIINLIKIKNNNPYTIALFHHIGFIEHLEQNMFRKKNVLYKKLSTILGIDSSGRTVRGLINSLKPKSKENVSKYTSHNHLIDVIEDFKSILEEEI